MSEPNIIRKTALAVFKDKKVIMVRSHKNTEVFYTLGGKIEPGEDDIASLEREVMEEVSATIAEGSLAFLHEFEAPAHGKENSLVNIRLYSGTLTGEPQAANEIAEIAYFDSTVDAKHLSETGAQILAWLKSQSLIA